MACYFGEKLFINKLAGRPGVARRAKAQHVSAMIMHKQSRKHPQKPL